MATVIGFVVAAVTLGELPRSSHSLLWMRSLFGEDAHLRSCYYLGSEGSTQVAGPRLRLFGFGGTVDG